MTPRHGLTTLEIAVSIFMLGVLLALSVQVLGWTGRERRSADRRATALIEAGNLLDELTRLPWDQLTAERLKAATLSSEAIAILPDAMLEATLRESDVKPPAKQITVSIDWLGDHGERQAPVRLTAWAFK